MYLFEPSGPCVQGMGLAVGVSHYSTLDDCPRSVADALDVAGKLSASGFSCVALANPSKRVLMKQLARLVDSVTAWKSSASGTSRSQAKVVFYFSGHCIQGASATYLVLGNERGECPNFFAFLARKGATYAPCVRLQSPLFPSGNLFTRSVRRSHWTSWYFWTLVKTSAFGERLTFLPEIPGILAAC
jgi:hypothetical protein